MHDEKNKNNPGPEEPKKKGPSPETMDRWRVYSWCQNYCLYREWKELLVTIVESDPKAHFSNN